LGQDQKVGVVKHLFKTKLKEGGREGRRKDVPDR